MQIINFFCLIPTWTPLSTSEIWKCLVNMSFFAECLANMFSARTYDLLMANCWIKALILPLNQTFNIMVSTKHYLADILCHVLSGTDLQQGRGAIAHPPHKIIIIKKKASTPTQKKAN